MATTFNTQVGDGQFKLQFETDDQTSYRVMQELARLCVDRDQYHAEKSAPEKPKTYEITAIHTIEVTHISKGVPDGKLHGQLDHLKTVAPGRMENRLLEMFDFLDDVKTANMQVFVREEKPEE